MPGAGSCRSSPGLSSPLGSVSFVVGLDALNGLSQPKRFHDSMILSHPNRRRVPRTTACPLPAFHLPKCWVDQPWSDPPVPLWTTLVFLEIRGVLGHALQERRGEVQPRAASPPRSLPAAHQPPAPRFPRTPWRWLAPAPRPAPESSPRTTRIQRPPSSSSLVGSGAPRGATSVAAVVAAAARGVKPAAFQGRCYPVLSQRPQ